MLLLCLALFLVDQADHLDDARRSVDRGKAAQVHLVHQFTPQRMLRESHGVQYTTRSNSAKRMCRIDGPYQNGVMALAQLMA